MYGLLKYSAMIRFYYGKEPEKLTEDEFINLVHELTFMLDFEGKRATTHGNLKNMPTF